MSRLLVLLAVPAVVWAAPALRTRSSTPFDFPTIVGTTWVYEENGEEQTQILTEVERTEAATSVTVSVPGKVRAIPRSRFVLSAAGVSQSMLLNGETSEPRCVLRLPAKSGDRWGFHVDAESPQFAERKGVSRTVGEEVVEVGAGRFTAVRVDTDLERPGGTDHHTAWLVSGVGFVKQEVSSGGKATRSISLKSFSPAKK